MSYLKERGIEAEILSMQIAKAEDWFQSFDERAESGSISLSLEETEA